MTVLSKLLSRSTPKYRISATGNYAFNIVGESNYQAAIRKAAKGHPDSGADVITKAVIVPEILNHYDWKAVRVDIGGKTVGYLSRSAARKHRERLKKTGISAEPIECEAKIVGGYTLEDGDRAHYGVKLGISSGVSKFKVEPIGQ